MERIEARIVGYYPDKGYWIAKGNCKANFHILRSQRAFATLNDDESEIKLDLDTASVVRDPIVGDILILEIEADERALSRRRPHVYPVKWVYKINYERKLLRTQCVGNERKKLQTTPSQSDVNQTLHLLE